MYMYVHTCMGTVASVVYLRCLFNRVNAFNGVLSNINLSCYSISSSYSWIVCGSIVQVEAENVQFQEVVVTITPSDPYLPVITPFRSEHHSLCVCVCALLLHTYSTCSYILSEGFLCHSTEYWGLTLCCIVDLEPCPLSCPGSSVGRALCLESRVSWVESHPGQLLFS